MLVRTDTPKLLLAGMKTEFMKAYDDEIVPEYEKIATVIKSDSDQETYPWLGSIGKMKEWKDERTPEAMLEHNFTVVNRDWEGTLAIDRNEIEDAKYGQIKIRVRQLAQEAKRFIGELAFELLGEGDQSTGAAGTNFSGKDINCYDGNPFFYGSHSEGDSGVQSNKGTAAFTLANLKTAITAMKGIKDDKGKYLNINPDLLVINQSDEWTAKEILNSSFYPAEATNMKLATNVLKGALKLYTTPYLESGTWAIMDTKSVVKPLIIQMRKDIQFTQLTTGPDAFMRKKLYFGVDARFEIAFGMWQYAYASNSGW